MSRLLGPVLARPGAVVAVAVLALGPAVLGAARLRLDNDPRSLAPADPGREAANDRHARLFGADDTLLLVVVSGEDSATLVRTVASLEDSLTDHGQVREVRSPCSVPVPVRRGDTLTFTPAFGPGSERQDDMRGRVAALRDWTGAPSLVSADGHHMVLAIRLTEELRDPRAARQFVDSLEDTLARTVPDGVRARLGGLVATRVGSVRAMIRDGSHLFPWAGLVVFLVAFARFRSARYAASLFGSLLFGITLTAGFAGAMGYALNPLTQTFPILLMVIGVADGVHLVERCAQASQRCGSPRAAWAEALQDTGGACVLTSVTTAVGFLALLTTRLPVLHQFALIVSVGACFALLSNLFLLPALCQLVCRGAPQLSLRRGRWFAPLAVFSYRHGRPIMVLGGLLLAGLLVLDSQLHVDFFFSRVLDRRAPVSEGNALLAEHFGGSIPLEITVSTAEGDFFDPGPLRALDALTERLREGGWSAVSHSVSLKKARRALAGDGSLPDDRALASQLGLFIESARLPPLLAEGDTVARLSALGPDVGGAALLDLQRELADYADTLPSIGVSMVGSMIAASEGFGTLVRELIVGLLLAALVVIGLIGVTFRSPRAALISALPNILPIALGMAVFPALGRSLDIFGAIFFTVALGIAVDDTIHTLGRFRLERARASTSEEAIARAARGIGPALADTSWILMTGFGLLVFSEFPANRLSGVLAAGLIGAALICDLVFLPAAVRVFGWSGDGE